MYNFLFANNDERRMTNDNNIVLTSIKIETKRKKSIFVYGYIHIILEVDPILELYVPA